MEKLPVITTVSILLFSVNAIAHHPAAEIVDPEVYAMIEENISDNHLELTFDDMNGATTTQEGSNSRSRDNDDSNGMAAGTEVEDSEETGSSAVDPNG